MRIIDWCCVSWLVLRLLVLRRTLTGAASPDWRWLAPPMPAWQLRTITVVVVPACARKKRSASSSPCAYPS
eukprot:scaffold69117_cov67-Phaeocystis_antarctica.AAC.5